MIIKVGGVPEHFNYPWIKLIQSRAFSHLGVEVEWVNFPGGTGAMSEALNNEEIHIALMLTEGSVKQIAEGMPFQILQKYIATPLKWGIYTHPEATISSIKELEKSKAAISRYGSGSHLMTYLLAKSENWDKNHLSFLEVNDLEGGLSAIKHHKATYFMWEHFTTKPFVALGDFKQIGIFPTPWPCFVVVVKQNLYQQFSEKIEAIIAIVNKLSTVLKSSINVSKQISEMFNLTQEDVESWLNVTDWSDESFSQKEHMFVLELLEKSGIIKK